jgi:hypothetical protein
MLNEYKIFFLNGKIKFNKQQNKKNIVKNDFNEIQIKTKTIILIFIFNSKCRKKLSMIEYQL